MSHCLWEVWPVYYLAVPSCHIQAHMPPHHPWVALAPPVSWSGMFLPRLPAFWLWWGGAGCCPDPGSLGPWLLQANVEHMTEKMKTEIQRGLVLR